MLRQFLTNLQEVLLGTKLAVLFPAIPLAVAADVYNFGRVSACMLYIINLFDCFNLNEDIH